MIAVDTNLLVRLFIEDDPAQTTMARDVVRRCTEAEPAYVSREVVVEFAWVLGRSSGMPKKGVVEALETLMSLPNIRF